jgi:hypothetical protein
MRRSGVSLESKERLDKKETRIEEGLRRRSNTINGAHSSMGPGRKDW